MADIHRCSWRCYGGYSHADPPPLEVAETRRNPVDDVIWSCPDCDGDLERDAYGLWCSRCEMVVPYACLPADPDDVREFL